MYNFKKTKKAFFSGLVIGAFLTMAPSLSQAGEGNVQSDAGYETASDSSATADQAGNEFAEGFKTLGNGFKKGAQVTGRAFKKAGFAIKNYFAGTHDSIEERDLGSEDRSDSVSSSSELKDVPYHSDLDKVGNAPTSKNQSRGGTDLESDAKL